jgi:2-octaprenyl-6-methoxyphenol hydroxylase
MTLVNKHFHITIVGGGLIGAALALALNQTGMKIAIIEAKDPCKISSEAYEDARSIALSHISLQIFNTLGLGAFIEKHLTPIRNIHISDRGHFGISRLSATNFKIPFLGATIEHNHLHEALWQQINAMENVTVFTPAMITKLQEGDAGYQLRMKFQESEYAVDSDLLIAADGSESWLRKQCALPIETKDYQQTAIVGNIGIKDFNNATAFERFTDQGPLALLPLGNQRCAFVWTLCPSMALEMLQLSNPEFLKHFQKAFGYRLGRFQWLGHRQAFPLKYVFAKEKCKKNMLLLGNAAHTLHPIAGQGFNLALRDVGSLAEVLKNHFDNAGNLIDGQLLKKFIDSRSHDHWLLKNFTNQLLNIFSPKFFPLVMMRNLGLLAFDQTPIVKNYLTKKTMGFINPLSNLALGMNA